MCVVVPVLDSSVKCTNHAVFFNLTIVCESNSLLRLKLEVHWLVELGFNLCDS